MAIEFFLLIQLQAKSTSNSLVSESVIAFHGILAGITKVKGATSKPYSRSLIWPILKVLISRHQVFQSLNQYFFLQKLIDNGIIQQFLMRKVYIYDGTPFNKQRYMASPCTCATSVIVVLMCVHCLNLILNQKSLLDQQDLS